MLIKHFALSTQAYNALMAGETGGGGDREGPFLPGPINLISWVGPMSVKLATATATDSASVTDFVQNGHEGAVWPADSKNQVHFDLGSLLQGQNQGQTKGNALAPKLTVRLR